MNLEGKDTEKEMYVDKQILWTYIFKSLVIGHGMSF